MGVLPSLILTALYLVLTGISNAASVLLGTKNLITAPFCALFAIILYIWLKKSSLEEGCGLRPFRGEGKDVLCFLPLVLIGTCNLWGGVALPEGSPELALEAVTLLAVAFLEELLFRGLLFRAMQRSGLTHAAAVSAVIFGLTHLMNLANGADPVRTLLQAVYAAAIGFAFAAVLQRSGSLRPCIVTHAAINLLSLVGKEPPMPFPIATAAVVTVAALLYGAWLLRGEPKEG